MTKSSDTKVEYVCGFLFHDEYVLLVQKARPDWCAGRLNGVGGKVEGEESPAEAMAREFLEETGVKTDAGDWRHFHTLTGETYRVRFFDARTVGGRPDARGQDDEPVYWLPWKCLPESCLFNLNWLIPLSRDRWIAVPTESTNLSQPDVDTQNARRRDNY